MTWYDLTCDGMNDMAGDGVPIQSALYGKIGGVKLPFSQLRSTALHIYIYIYFHPYYLIYVYTHICIHHVIPFVCYYGRPCSTLALQRCNHSALPPYAYARLEKYATIRLVRVSNLSCLVLSCQRPSRNLKLTRSLDAEHVTNARTFPTT